MLNRALQQAIETAGVTLPKESKPLSKAFFERQVLIENKQEPSTSLQIIISAPVTYSAVESGLLELDSSQKIYNLEQVKNLLIQKNKTISFTYAIDLDNQVIFSIGATSSFHINLCKKKPVHGAGEVYLKRTDRGLEVERINNRSGLYRPRIEFLKPMKEWFKQHGFIIDTTRLEDERVKMIRNDIQVRASFRF